MAGFDNANPIVLNAAELPTRRRKSPTSSVQHSGIRDILNAKMSYMMDPFEMLEPLHSDGYGEDDTIVEPIDEQEIFDLISTISDPEHPLSLGSLAVVSLPDIHITPTPSSITFNSTTLHRVLVEITPTITHCSLATVIGLGVRVRLEQSLPPNFRVDVRIKEGTHSQDEQVNKQLGDKERVAAALENATLMGVLRNMLSTCA